MKQELKKSIVGGIKFALGITFFVVALYLPDVIPVIKNNIFVSIPYVLVFANIFSIGLLKLTGEDNPLMVIKTSLVCLAVILSLGLYLILPIWMMSTKALALVFLGFVIGCVQIRFLFTKPVRLLIKDKIKHCYDWVG